MRLGTALVLSAPSGAFFFYPQLETSNRPGVVYNLFIIYLLTF